MPDRHHYRGSYGGKDVLPLYRDAAATQSNLHPALLGQLGASLGCEVTPENFAAYVYALLAQPAFTERFHDELQTRELRLPLTTGAALFARAVTLGRELLFLHTFGERFGEDQQWPRPQVKCLKAVAGGQLPDKFGYDAAVRVIRVDSGEFGPVAPQVWEYEVSGLKVVQSWLGYRMRKRKGKKSSPLDEITPAEWGSDYTSEFLRLLNLLTRTLEIHPQQAELLDAVLTGPLLPASALGPVPPQWRAAPKVVAGQAALID